MRCGYRGTGLGVNSDVRGVACGRYRGTGGQRFAWCGVRTCVRVLVRECSCESVKFLTSTTCARAQTTGKWSV